MTGTISLPSKEDIIEALEAVHDPHVPVSLRRMGMLRDIEIDADGGTKVQVCIPCMGCPGVGMLRENVREAVLSVPGVKSVVVEEGWPLPWSRNMIDTAVSSRNSDRSITVMAASFIPFSL